MPKSPGTAQYIEVDGVTISSSILARTQTVQAVKFWEKLQEEFPSKRVGNHIEALKEGRADWFRGIGLMNTAVAENSRNTSGSFSMFKYDRNIKRARELFKESGLMGSQMQD